MFPYALILYTISHNFLEATKVKRNKDSGFQKICNASYWRVRPLLVHAVCGPVYGHFSIYETVMLKIIISALLQSK